MSKSKDVSRPEVKKVPERAQVDPEAIPDGVYRRLASALLESMKNHPELKEQYEKETGKSFYRKK